MTISTTYTQGLSLAISITTTAGAAPGAAARPSPAAAGTDSADLSPEAHAAAASAIQPTPQPVLQSTTAAPAAPSRTDALMSALDADGDGSVTAKEFVNGAEKLLRQGAFADRHRHHHGYHRADAHDGGMRRLEGRLQTLFNKLDADGNGSVDKGELAAALGESAPTDAAQTASPDAQAPAASSVTQVTFVAVALQQYTVTAASGSPQPSGFAAAA